MRHLLNRKALNLFVTALGLAALALGVAPAAKAQVPPPPAVPAFVLTPVNGGWTKFDWSSTVRGAFTFSPLFTSIDASLLNSPSLVTFAASAKVACPPVGNAQVSVQVYDFNQLIFSTTYSVKCPAAPVAAYPTAKGGDDYLNDAHYFHGSVPIATGGAHNLVIVTNLATTDDLYWGYVRVDAAPNVPPTLGITTAAIALTVVNPPANAWVGVQWGDPAGVQWNDVATWFNPLDQATTGRMVYWVDSKNYGSAPYRWVVYTGDPRQGGKVWGMSDPFYFPKVQGDWVWSQARQLPAPVK